jgi:hypothetical protein
MAVVSAVWTTVTTAAQTTSSAPASATFNVVEATIDDVEEALRARRISCRDLVESIAEPLLFKLAFSYEQATRHRRPPELMAGQTP